MEDVVNRGHVGQETGLKRPISLKGLKACGELGSGSGQCTIWAPYGKAHRLSRRKGCLAAQKAEGLWGLIIWVCIVGSFQIGTRDVTKGMSGYPPHLAKENEHVIKGLGH